MTQRSERVPRVAVLVDTSTGWGRRLIRGVSNYIKKHGSWDVWIEPRGQSEEVRLPRNWQGDGVIARISTRQAAEHLIRRRLPVVNVSAIRASRHRFVRVAVDEDELAAVAVEHFTERGLPSIGYVGLPDRSYSNDRMSALARSCGDRGMAFYEYPGSTPAAGAVEGGAPTTWSREHKLLSEWLGGLPKPVGVLSWDVALGLRLLSAAKATGFRIPDDIAVLSGDDDELLCEMCDPTLSGIVVPSEQMGYEAARSIAQQLNGEPAEPIATRFKPTGIIARVSTDVLAVDDPELASAIRFIRSSADRPIQVADVTDRVMTSRRSLERRFQRRFNRTIGEEIAKVHLERAKYLLGHSDLPIPKVSDAAGYGSPEYFATVFRKAVGMSPLAYRMQCQGR